MRLRQNETLRDYKARLLASVASNKMTAQKALAKYERAYLVDQIRRSSEAQTKTLIYS